MESVTGTNGIIIPPAGYMQGVRALCDKYGIDMIADEVMSGFGRTGKWFAIEHWDVVPDIMTMAKGLTSAYAPLGAVAMKPEIAAAFNDTPFESGLTYTSHPISLAAAVANIHVMREDKIVEHAAGMGPVLKRMLTDLGQAHPSVGEVRSIGLFGILELVKDRGTKEPLAPWNASSPAMIALRKYCLDHGLFLYPHWHDAATIQPRERAWIVVEAPSLDLVLVDWLNEIVFRFDVDEMLVARTSPRVIQEGDTWKLEAAVEGETIEAARHHVKLLIKGVTYHQLTIAHSDRGFETSVVFDI